MMIKLIKATANNVYYWEIWQTNVNLVIHEGTVGNVGHQSQINIEISQQPQKMSDLAQQVIVKGYKIVSIDDLTDIVIQYQIDGFGAEHDLNKRIQIQHLMDQCLGWTGNGHCDGGDIGSGTMNIFCYVIAVEKAVATVKAELEKYGYLNGAVIAIEKEDEYIAVYPQGAPYVY